MACFKFNFPKYDSQREISNIHIFISIFSVFCWIILTIHRKLKGLFCLNLWLKAYVITKWSWKRCVFFFKFISLLREMQGQLWQDIEVRVANKKKCLKIWICAAFLGFEVKAYTDKEAGAEIFDKAAFSRISSLSSLLHVSSRSLLPACPLSLAVLSNKGKAGLNNLKNICVSRTLFEVHVQE